MDDGVVVVTGADGFIGHALASRWSRSGRRYRGLVRRLDRSLAPKPANVEVGDLARASDDRLAGALAGAVALVHLAGRAHVMRETAADGEAAYREANVAATERLAGAAVRAGVARFILASTVKVHGEASPRERALRPDDPLAPRGAYARSKCDAERILVDAAKGTPMTPLVLRLPLVYGPGVKGNFAALLEAVAHGRRLPLAAIAARRSIAYVGNVAAAIEAALDANPTPDGAHFVADHDSVTAAEIARALADALGKPARLYAVPLPLLKLAAALIGRGEAVARLVTPLEIDTSSFAAATGFVPPYTLAEGVAATAAWWRVQHAI
jgi:nucleoside-diphosphate-sugar epimerase